MNTEQCLMLVASWPIGKMIGASERDALDVVLAAHRKQVEALKEMVARYADIAAIADSDKSGKGLSVCVHELRMDGLISPR